MSRLEFSIAKQFSVTPGPRNKVEGPHSGEQLLEVLLPLFRGALDQDAVLSVDLDGTAGYATSFLEAVFGGLAREFGADQVLSHLEFHSEEEPYLIDEVTKYVREANEA
jgi:hypothetical protein